MPARGAPGLVEAYNTIEKLWPLARAISRATDTSATSNRAFGLISTAPNSTPGLTEIAAIHSTVYSPRVPVGDGWARYRH